MPSGTFSLIARLERFGRGICRRRVGVGLHRLVLTGNCPTVFSVEDAIAENHMHTPARSNASYEFLDQHAYVLERLLPAVRSIAFFDAKGRPLRGRGPVPIGTMVIHARKALDLVSAGADRTGESIFPVTPAEYAAVLVLYAKGRTVAAGRNHGTATSGAVAGICLLTLQVPVGAPHLALETLHGQLDPALICVGRELAHVALNAEQSRLPKEDAAELDWLFEVSAPAPTVDGSALHNHREQLSRMLAASVEHLGCVLGALLVPDRHLRLVHAATGTPAGSAEEALTSLEGPLLTWARRNSRPMLVNEGRAAGPSRPALRLLAVPVAGHTIALEGTLVFLRSMDDPEFNRAQLSLARHLSRHICTLLETEFDLATGLYTRTGVQRHAESWEARAEHSRACAPHAVICINIDRLHVVNEMRGFEEGDALIIQVARLLQEPNIPPGAAAARISGNEFGVVLPNTDAAVAERTARALQQLAAHLSDEAVIAQEPVSLSCGVASFTDPTEFQRGLALAELACRTAQDHGHGRVEVYQDNDASMVRRHTDIVAVQQLRKALREDRLTLFAQRIMPLQRQDDVGGYELLLRNLDQPHENHAPATLLSAALRNHLAHDLDFWVIEHGISEAAPYRSELLAANVSLSINITGPSLTDERFLERVCGLIRGSGMPPSLIMFEITETVAVLSLAKAVAFIRKLRALGCRFALDDFGTGTNSLKNLTSLPVDRVKIDGSFVSDILTNHQSAAMVRAIVSLARDLGITTVAEYAENKRIIERLRELGVPYAQGYGVERPRPFAEVLKELRARQAEPDFMLSLQI
jgi:diguanylate cyclase (GGDEF)-like protein